MNRRLIAFCFVLLLQACTPEAQPPTVPVNRATASALTPQPTATATATTSPTATTPPTETPTTAPPTNTPTPGPLVDVSYCSRPFGPIDGSRFSARLVGVRADAVDQFDQLILTFEELSGELQGSAGCAWAAAWPEDVDVGSTGAPNDAFIGLALDDWAHDDLWASSPITETIAITGSDVFQNVAFAASSLDSRGTLIGIGLDEPRAFRIRIEDASLIVEVAREIAFPPADDPLGEDNGDLDPPAQPVFFLQNGDVYRLQNGQAEQITQSPELETGLAISPDGQMLAVCRAPADAEPFALPYDVRATLWTLNADGSDEQLLADVGGCAEPAFAASGRTIAWTANVAPSPPAVLQVWTVPVVGGDAAPATTGVDEWSRSQPRWLRDGRLVYHADNGSQSVVFLRQSDGSEREITAQMLTGATYRGVGQFVVDPATDQIAVEALRRDDDGADLIVLRPDGTQVAAEQRGFWQRPLAYSADGLVYLTADCPSGGVLRYTLQLRTAQGRIEGLATGETAAAIGAATAAGDALLYVRSETIAAGVRGPILEPQAGQSSGIWQIALDDGAVSEVLAVDDAITGLQATSR